MTTRRLWTIIIKIAGLYGLWQLILAVPSYINVLLSLNSGGGLQDFWYVLIMFFQPVFLGLIAFLCLFKTDTILTSLRLNNNGDEILQLNIHRSLFIKITVIMLGGYFFLDGLPTLFGNLAQFLQIQSNEAFYKNRAFGWLFASVIKVTLGYCMIAYSRWFVNYVELKRRKIS